MTYESFIATKASTYTPAGFNPAYLPDHLFASHDEVAA